MHSCFPSANKERITKAIAAAGGDMGMIMAHVLPVAIDVCKDVLKQYGFDTSPMGVCPPSSFAPFLPSPKCTLPSTFCRSHGFLDLRPDARNGRRRTEAASGFLEREAASHALGAVALGLLGG